MKASIQKYAPHMREEVINMTLREEDRLEVLAASGLNSREALEQSIDASLHNLWVAKVNSKIIAIFGRSQIAFIGIPWLLGTDALDNLKVSFMKYSRSFINLFMFDDEVDYLTNYVSSTHTSSIKWLEWLGFTIGYDKEIYLKDKSVVFYQFWMHKPLKETRIDV